MLREEVDDTTKLDNSFDINNCLYQIGLTTNAKQIWTSVKHKFWVWERVGNAENKTWEIDVV